jgi:hypothetical protein
MYDTVDALLTVTVEELFDPWLESDDSVAVSFTAPPPITLQALISLVTETVTLTLFRNQLVVVVVVPTSLLLV